MLEQFLDYVGNWNPQFRRELKTRLNLPNLAISTTISCLMQALTVILPDLRVLSIPCEWMTPHWWLNICGLLDREIWFALAIGGIYVIARDFDREIHSGTLDLVNLSPVKPLAILSGQTAGRANCNLLGGIFSSATACDFSDANCPHRSSCLGWRSDICE